MTRFFRLLSLACLSMMITACSHKPAPDPSQVLPLPNRVAFMAGHVAAGLTLYRAGEPQMAAPHLLHPVSETHASEREGLAQLGFQPALFERVSAALESQSAAADVEGDLSAAEKNMAHVAVQAGGDSRQVIRFLMATVLEEYEAGVSETRIVELGEYQDAFGFTQVALQHAERLGNLDLQIALKELLGLWKGAPLPSPQVAAVESVETAVAVVLQEL